MKTRLFCAGTLHYLLIGLFVHSLAGPAVAQSFMGLGDLPGGNIASRAFDVSGDGSTAVGCSDITSTDEAFRWTANDGMTGLGDLPGGSFQSEARGASDDGTVVVGISNSSDGREAFRWEDGTMIGLGDLPGGSFTSEAYGVSGDGSRVAGVSVTGSGVEAFLWTSGGGMVGLGDLSGGGGESFGYDISADGAVVVGTSNRQAFRWTETEGMTGLGHLPGGDDSTAYGVSRDGAFIVGVSDGAAGVEAFLWTSGEGMVGLGVLQAGDASTALDVSADGGTVVGISKGPGGCDAFIWDQDHGIRKLQDVLVNDYGLDLAGWLLREATGISDDSTVIVGEGVSPDGHREGWIAILADGTTTVCGGGGKLIEGFGEINDFNAACGSDDEYWSAHGASLFFQVADPVVQFELTATSPAGIGVGTISVDIEARKETDTANLNLRVLMFNYDSGSYVALPGILPLAVDDATQNFGLPGGANPEHFIEDGTNEVRLLIQTIQTSGLPNVRTQLDEVLFSFQ